MSANRKQPAHAVAFIRGAGEIASATAHRLHRRHFRVCLTELDAPLDICRGTCFSAAVLDKTKTVEEVTAELVPASPVDVEQAELVRTDW